MRQLIAFLTCIVLTTSASGQEVQIFPIDTPMVVPLWHRVGDFSPRLRSVEACEFSPDGRYAVSGAKFGYGVMLWRVADGALLWENAHESEVECVVFSPDGTRIATGGEDYFMRVWDVKTGAQLYAHEFTDAGIDGITWSPDGRYIVAGDEMGNAIFFNAMTYRETSRMNCGSTINSLEFSKDNKFLAVGGNIQTPDPNGPGGNLYEGFAKVIDVEKMAVVTDVGKQDGSIKSIRWSPDGTMLATGGFDNKARLFYAASGKLIKSFENPLKIEAVAFSPDGNFLLTGGHEQAINFYRLKDGALVHRQPSGRVEYLDFTQDGRLLLVGCEDSGLLSCYLILSNTQASGNYQKIADKQLNNRDLKN